MHFKKWSQKEEDQVKHGSIKAVYYNILFKINNIEMYLTYNEGKFVVAERFIRTLKNKIFKHMTAVLKNAYFDVFWLFC